jgi:hypothetical protein
VERYGENKLRKYFMPTLPVRAGELVSALRLEKYPKAHSSSTKILGVVEIVKALLDGHMR